MQQQTGLQGFWIISGAVFIATTLWLSVKVLCGSGGSMIEPPKPIRVHVARGWTSSQAGDREGCPARFLLGIRSTYSNPLKGPTFVSRSRYLVVRKRLKLSIPQASSASMMLMQRTRSLKGKRRSGATVSTLYSCLPEVMLPSQGHYQGYPHTSGGRLSYGSMHTTLRSPNFLFSGAGVVWALSF